MANTLNSGQKLISNNHEKLVSNNGFYELRMQTDGNLVLYRNNHPIWATDTHGQDVESCTMQGDGNLVLRLEVSDRPIWASNTHGNPGSSLIVQDDGNVVIYNGSIPIWATGTHEQ